MKIEIKPIGFFYKIIDFLMIPIMYLVAGTFKEKPQQTHKWNQRDLSNEEKSSLSRDLMVCAFSKFENQQKRSLLFHIPILGGWREYVTLTPHKIDSSWYVGWHGKEVSGVSRIPLHGPVRVLIGPGEVCFFGVSKDGTQIPISHIGRGIIGKKYPDALKYPLL